MSRVYLGLISALLCLATTARADEATPLFRQGVAAFEQGHFQRSLSLLHRARRHASSPPIVAAIDLYLGINHAVLGKERKARLSFRSALQHNPTLVLDANQHKPAIVALFRKVQAAMRGHLVVEREGNAPASVFVDGRKVGQTPYRGTLPIGRHELVVRDSKGRDLLLREVIVGEAKTVRVTVNDSAVSKASRRPSTKQRRPRRRGRLWTWVAGGAATVAAIIGIGFGVAAVNAHSEYETTNDPARFDELAASIPDQVAAANAMYITAGVLATGAVVLFFLEGRRSRPRNKQPPVFDSVLIPALGPGSAGLGLSARF